MGAQLHIAVGRLTDRGRVRERNEDFVGGPEGISAEKLEQKGWLYVVADGMGGHLGGQRAARLAVERVIQEYYRDPSLDIPGSLERAIKLVNAEIYNEAARTPAYKGMGSTIVAAVVRGDDLYVANVGDSRAYLIRGPSIQQITRDHSWIADALRAGTITPEQALTHHNRGVVTRSLGGGPSVQVDHFHRKIHAGDVVLLCSDGLTNVVPDANIHAVVSNESPRKAAENLITMANQAGGPDNIAAIVIGVRRVPAAVPVRRRSLAPLVSGVAATALVLVIAFIVSTLGRPGPAPTPMPTIVTQGPAKTIPADTPAVAATTTSPPTSTPALTSTATPTPLAPTATPTFTQTLTSTPVPPTLTYIRPVEPTDTPTPMPTLTPTKPTPTLRPTATPTPLPTDTPTPQPTDTPTPTPTPTPTKPTPALPPTTTPTPLPTDTPTPQPTDTPTPLLTDTPTPLPTATPTPLPTQCRRPSRHERLHVF